MENSEKIDFDKLTVHEIAKLNLYNLTNEDFIKIADIFYEDNEKLDFVQKMNTKIDIMVHTTSRGYTTPLKEEITELKQENNELKEEITELKSQNQALQNNFNQLLGILLQQNPELKDQLQGLSGASGDMSELTSKDKGHTFGN